MAKPRIIKDFDRLDLEIQQQIKLEYPLGFDKHLVMFKNAKGESVSALLYETDEAYYLVRMTIKTAQQIIREDDDYDDNGILKDEVKLDYTEKFEGEDYEDDEDSSDDDDYDEEDYEDDNSDDDEDMD